ncbi:MAG: hypothetical protein ABL984_05175 [Pyrinomonadaceae bacterium]
MKIAKIVSSNSHIAYVARVLDGRDDEVDPPADEYSFGKFVSIDDGAERIVGVISDSRLVNPEYLSPSTRLGQASALGELRRDLVEDKRTLIAILLLGSVADGLPVHSIPLKVLPSGSDVESMSGEAAAEFHRDTDGGVRMGYFPSLMSHSGPLSTTLARTIIDGLKPHFSDTEQQKLAVMADSLSWKQAFGDSRF